MDINNLPDDIEKLKNIIIDHEEHIEILEMKMTLLIKALFAPSSEKKYPFDEQLFLPFCKTIEANDAEVESEEHHDAVQDAELPKTKNKTKRGRRLLPSNLPYIEHLIDIPEEKKVCQCGAPLVRIGEEVSEKLDYIPAQLRIIRYIRPQYACKDCQGTESSSKTILIAPPLIQLIPKGIATPSLLTHIIISKFADALPFYRQQAQFKRIGIEIPRSTMSAWCIYVAEACNPLIALLTKNIRSGPLINMDETPLQVLKELGRKNTTKSFIWVFRGGDPQRPSIVFKYDPSRSKKVPEDFVGDTYQGYIQTDGYAGYDALGQREGIIHLGCLIHVRRKFMDILKAVKKTSKIKGSTTQKALSLIREIYRLEKQAQDEKMSNDQIRDLRMEKAVPVLDKFKKLLDETISQTPPSGLLHKAIAYALGQWDRLVRYTENGMLRPDNNLTENVIRPVALGRKNWLFAGSPRGARAGMVFFSLISTAKANGLDAYTYLRHVFEMLPEAILEDNYKKLLPQNFTPETLPTYL